VFIRKKNRILWSHHFFFYKHLPFDWSSFALSLTRDQSEDVYLKEKRDQRKKNHKEK
jgi:hypothetical protein